MRSRLRVCGVSLVLATLAFPWLTPTASADTIINVTIPGDTASFPDGECSLREAIASAGYNFHKFEGFEDECASGSGNDTIVLPTDTYMLTVGDFFVDPVEPFPGTGDLDIFEQASGGGGAGSAAALQPEVPPVLTIEGNGSIVDASELEHCCDIPAPDRVFHILGVPAVINDLTIQGGGGIFDLDGDGDGTEEIVARGGGILVDREPPAGPYLGPGGALQLNSSIVRSNTARDGGGIYNNEGHVELLDTIVGDDDPSDEVNQGNVASDDGGGIFTVPPPSGGGTVVVDGSSVFGNLAATDGGGIYNPSDQAGDRVEVLNGSSVSENVAGAECFGDDPVEDDPALNGGDGGGIWNEAAAQDDDPESPGVNPGSPGVFIDASAIEGNAALDCTEDDSKGNGAGMYNVEGHVELTNGSTVGPDNHADSEGGGIYSAGGGDGQLTVIVDGSHVDGNLAGEDGGGIYNGGARFDEGDRVEIRNESTVSENIAGAHCLEEPPQEGGGNGGGIWTNARADLGIFQEVPPDSPGVFIDDSTVEGNEALNCALTMETYGNGGGIYALDGAHVEIMGDSTIGPDNVAACDGGGIWTSDFRQLDDTLLIDQSTVEGNFAEESGGGIYNAFDQVEITNSTVADNTAENGYGGGIYTLGFNNQIPNLTVFNSTISGNFALFGDTEIGSGVGGGIYLGNGSFELDSVTLNENDADLEGGNIGIGTQNPKNAFLHNTIVANGEPQNCALDEGIDDIDSFGFNLTDESVDSCGLEDETDIVGQGPGLDPLANNGGPTQTHALSRTSPAVDSGPPGGGVARVAFGSGWTAVAQQDGCPPADQRGEGRPQDGDGDGTPVCDRGAFELEPATATGGAGPGPVLPPRECDVLGTPAADVLVGTPLGETICGLAGDDTIRGEGGNDNLFGDEGDDRLNGGPGDDALVGGPGTDTGDYSGAPGSVDANLTTGAATGVGASTDGLFTLENLIGSAFDDILTGDGGPNNLKGKGGNDKMNGRGGNDFLKGARGNDKGRGSGGNDTVKGGHDRDNLKGGTGNDTITGGQKKDKLKGNQGDDNVRGGGHDDHINGNAGTDDCSGGSGNNTIVNCEL